MRRISRLRVPAAIVLATFVGWGQTPTQTGVLSGSLVGVHDPSMIREEPTWYVFGSGGRPLGPQIPLRCSQDLHDWTPCGHLFDQGIPEWIRARLPGVRDLWAPDISYVDGEYRVYYAYSILGKNTSGIALVVNKTLDRQSPSFAWVDRGTIVESQAGDDFNAIDPNFFRDANGADWLVFGSFWSGIKMRRLGADGRLLEKDRHMYSLAKRKRPGGVPEATPGIPEPWEAIEAPYLVRHLGFYYLFTSWDHCCRGAQSNYHVFVGRATNVKGPYLDEAGSKLMKGGGTEILSGSDEWAGPGGESLWMNPAGNDLMVYHAYDTTTGRPSLRISVIEWKDGWPHVKQLP